ncbi:Uncharacterized protein SCF082_LOCUS22967, partial [Durusdinium trenchii]
MLALADDVCSTGSSGTTSSGGSAEARRRTERARDDDDHDAGQAAGRGRTTQSSDEAAGRGATRRRQGEDDAEDTRGQDRERFHDVVEDAGRSRAAKDLLGLDASGGFPSASMLGYRTEMLAPQEDRRKRTKQRVGARKISLRRCDVMVLDPDSLMDLRAASRHGRREDDEEDEDADEERTHAPLGDAGDERALALEVSRGPIRAEQQGFGGQPSVVVLEEDGVEMVVLDQAWQVRERNRTEGNEDDWFRRLKDREERMISDLISVVAPGMMEPNSPERVTLWQDVVHSGLLMLRLVPVFIGASFFSACISLISKHADTKVSIDVRATVVCLILAMFFLCGLYFFAVPTSASEDHVDASRVTEEGFQQAGHKPVVLSVARQLTATAALMLIPGALLSMVGLLPALSRPARLAVYYVASFLGLRTALAITYWPARVPSRVLNLEAAVIPLVWLFVIVVMYVSLNPNIEPWAEILVSGVIYPLIVASAGRVLFADLLVFLTVTSFDSVLGPAQMVFYGASVKQLMHFGGQLLLIQVSGMATFVVSVVLANLVELSSVFINYKLQQGSTRRWLFAKLEGLSHALWHRRTRPRDAHAQERRFVRSWLGMFSDHPMEKLAVCFVAEEAADKVNAMVAGVAGLMISLVNQGCDDYFELGLRIVILASFEFLEDLAKKRLVQHYLNIAVSKIFVQHTLRIAVAFMVTPPCVVSWYLAVFY